MSTEPDEAVAGDLIFAEALDLTFADDDNVEPA